MRNIKITDVRVHVGDAGFLVDDGVTSILYDTGFGFTGEALAQKVKKELGDRKLDYIFLTHSHYDHVLGAPYVASLYPEVKIIAGEYAAKIFGKPTAKETMRRLDRNFALKCGITDYEDHEDDLRVDITVKDGDELKLGDMVFTVINLPGHTRCSVGLYLAENKLLLSTETLGIYLKPGIIIPSYLIGYEVTLNSIRRAKALDIENILVPHNRVLNREETKEYLETSEHVAIEVADKIKNIFFEGGTFDDAKAYFTERFYTDEVKPIYPIDAYNLNTDATINLIKRELVDGIK